MSEKYSRIYTLSSQDAVCLENCPVEFIAGALLNEQSTGRKLAQIKFKNVSSKSIKHLTMSVRAYDSNGNLIKGIIEHTYENVGAASQAEFGSNMPIILNDNNSARINIELKQVEFSDGSHWNKFGEQVSQATEELASAGKSVLKIAIMIPAVIINTFISFLLLCATISVVINSGHGFSINSIIAILSLTISSIISLPGFGKIIFRKKYGFGQRILRWIIVFGILILATIINGSSLF